MFRKFRSLALPTLIAWLIVMRMDNPSLQTFTQLINVFAVSLLAYRIALRDPLHSPSLYALMFVSNFSTLYRLVSSQPTVLVIDIFVAVNMALTILSLLGAYIWLFLSNDQHP